MDALTELGIDYIDGNKDTGINWLLIGLVSGVRYSLNGSNGSCCNTYKKTP